MSEKKHLKSLGKIAGSLALIVVFAFVLKLLTFSAEAKKEKGTREEDDVNLATDQSYRDYISKNYKIYSLAMPEGLLFAGEKVPLQDIDVRERLDREVVINTFWHSSTMFNFKRANRWFPIMEKVLKQEGVPDDFKYISMIESGFENVVSPAGATGYWQFLKSTGIKYGLEINDYVDERYHVEKATHAAAAYFKEANGYFKNWTLTAASYNMGIAGVQQKLKEQGVKSYYDLLLVPETYRYVFRALAAKEIYENPRFYGFNVRMKDLYVPYETVSVEVDSTINDLAMFAKQKGYTYKVLKILNPWLRSDKLPVRPGKKYTILFPAKDFSLTAIEP